MSCYADAREYYRTIRSVMTSWRILSIRRSGYRVMGCKFSDGDGVMTMGELDPALSNTRRRAGQLGRSGRELWWCRQGRSPGFVRFRMEVGGWVGKGSNIEDAAGTS